MGPGERIKELKVLFRYLRAQTAKKEKKNGEDHENKK